MTDELTQFSIPARGLTGRKGRIMIDCFSTMDDLKWKDRNDPRKLLAVLAKVGKFSCFEVDARMAGAMTWLLQQSKWVTTRHTYEDGKDAYPWTFVTVTPEGRATLQSPEIWPGLTRAAPHK